MVLYTLSYAAVYYVTPHSPNPNCPSGEPCLTINEYAQRDHFNGETNISLIFLNGDHHLTARDFLIKNKEVLKVSPINQTEVKIQLSNETLTIVQSVYEIKISGVTFISKNSLDHNEPNCLSLKNTSHLSVTSVSIDSCLLSLQDGITTLITSLTTVNSYVNISSNNNVTIKSSKLHFSVINISDCLLNYHDFSDIITLRIESSLMTSSLFTVKLQTPLVYDLQILNTTVSSQDSSKTESGVKIRSFNSTMIHVFVSHCTIAGNTQGINIIADGNSTVDLNVDSCYIAHNGHVSDRAGGIEVSKSQYSNAETTTTISSTTLSGNRFAQLAVYAYSGSTEVTVFNSTFREAHGGEACLPLSDGLGAYFKVGNTEHCNRILLNLTKNHFQDNDNGVIIWGENNTYVLHFNENRVASSCAIGLGIVTEGKGTVSIANSHFMHSSGKSPIFINSSIMLTVEKTVIAQNTLGIVVLLTHKNSVIIVIKDSVFQENTETSLKVTNLQALSSETTAVVLNNVTFFNNTSFTPDSGIVQVEQRIVLNIENSCVFQNNKGSPILAFESTVILSGTIVFEDNIAFQGGAILLKFSLLQLKLAGNNTIVFFTNNTATNGGAIYVDGSINTDIYTGSSCFYEIHGVSLEQLNNSRLTLVFSNNSATTGGIDIYGATPNSDCFIILNNSSTTQSKVINSHIFNTSSELSSISSDPKRVCLCDSSSHLQCAELFKVFDSTTRYPGEVFPLSLAVVGFEFGTVSGPVYANILPQANDSKSSLDGYQYVRQVANKVCVQLNFTVNSFNTQETIVLTTNAALTTKHDDVNDVLFAISSYIDSPYNVIPSLLLTIPVHVSVQLLDCPPGFQLTNTGKCECCPAFKKIGIYNCSIYDNTRYITRSENQWIQIVNDTVISNKYCPFNYCKQNTMTLKVGDLDLQCALNHTGILCGACPYNLSLAIGSSRCLECTNDYSILLLIAFAEAGILLVLLIDVTVSKGTVNGLILYANIIWANQSVLFPPQTETSSLLFFLKAFIAWLNLDLGI